MAAHNSSKTQGEPKGNVNHVSCGKAVSHDRIFFLVYAEPTFEIQKCVVLTPRGSEEPQLSDLFPNVSAESSAEGPWVTCLQVEKNDKKEVNLVAAGSFWDHLKPDRDQRCDLTKLFTFVNPPNQGPLHDAFLITGPASLVPTAQESAKKSIFYVIPYFENSEESQRHLKRTLCQISSHDRVFIIVKPDLRAGLNELVKPYRTASLKITIISDLRQFKTRIANLPSPKHEIDCISADKFKCFLGNKSFALLSELQNVFEKQESAVQKMLCTFHDLGLIFCQGRSMDVQDPLVFTKPNYLYDFLSEANTVPPMDDDPDSATLEGFLGYSCAVFSDLYAVIDQLSLLLTHMGVTIDLNGDATFRHSLPTMDPSNITDIRERFFAQPLRFTVRQQCSISDTMYWQFVSKFSHRYGSKYADPVYNQNYSCFGCGPGSFLHIYKEGSSWIEVGYEQQAIQLKKQANQCNWSQHIFEKLSAVKLMIEGCFPGQELCIGFPCPHHPEAIAELQETDPNDSLQAFTSRCNHRDCPHSDMEWKQRIWYHKPDRSAQVS